MNKRLPPLFLAIPCFLPLLWRLLQKGASEPAGLVSDAAFGLLVFCLALYLPRLMRIALVGFWALFQAGSQELLASMQRLPSWQDLHYLADPSFIKNSTQGLHLASPVLSGVLLVSALLSGFFTIRPPAKRFFFIGLTLAGVLLAIQAPLDRHLGEASIAARYNPLHWFVADAIATPSKQADPDLPMTVLPASLRTLDLSGRSLLSGKGRAKNVLIITLEGIPGLYYPQIRQAMGVPAGPFEMQELAQNTPDATLVPDFVTHSHQTIRGLYAMLCGDFSKFSYEMSKAFEVQTNAARAGACLPAQMAENGWETHYLQGAGLAFMNKDKVMPAIGFQHVHGSEWFTEPDPYPFMWGKTDPVFFRGARRYIADLQAKHRPWLLTLLTVGTHQPYAAPDAIVARYPNRMIATSAILDDAVGEFLRGIREDGVLEDTLVIITSDESHGDAIADWISSWGLMVILAPEGKALPRIKTGSYGMLDITASVLDYLGLPPPASIIGRSFFRDYTTPREMISYTTSKLRWHTADNRRFECTAGGPCNVGTAPSLIGIPPADFGPDRKDHAPQLFAMAATLDHKLTSRARIQRLHFGDGKIIDLPETLTNEWTDNLVGAQYLDFPDHSKVHVSIRVKALDAPSEGIQLKLTLRQFEKLVQGVDPPAFPRLHAGEESRIAFDIDNPTRANPSPFT
ncbi:LTA synthase family protein [Desulfosarcina cetonica]|uniref:LTA synthase family protein n=1 Tax=Desulfosarcina cetonica TaxID=90730 RepID=UPI0006D09A2B|nr:LTA synthase family protein [Desulfosarcina cetonica]